METFDCISSRRSCKRFKKKDVEREKLGKILEAARWAPSPGNVQSQEFIVVKDPEKKEYLSKITKGTESVSQAPVTVIVISDIKKMKRKYGSRGRDLYAIQETSAAMQNMLLVAHDQGLCTFWTGDFKEELCKDYFEIPNRCRPVAIISFGYPKKEPSRPNKMEVTDVTYLNQYGNQINPVYDKFEWEGLRNYSKEAKNSLSDGLDILKDKFE